MSDETLTFPYHTVAITGGTGTFGTACLAHLRQHAPDTHVRIISRHEDLQIQMQRAFGNDHISYLLGDVCDPERMRLAFQGVDCVLHAAAYKHIDRAEYDPWAFIRTNITGTYTVLHAAIIAGVQQCVLLSTDKAVEPSSVYGTTKKAAEHLTIQANHYSPHGTRLCAVRYGNVAFARGSVILAWRDALAAGKPLFVTDERMTRFWMTIDEAVRLVLWTATHGLRGGIAVPHLPAFAITDLARAMLSAGDTWQVTGRRPGEKLAEILMSAEEQERAWWYGPSDTTPVHYVIPPLVQYWGDADPQALWAMPPKALAWGHMGEGATAYVSDTWPWRLRVDELRKRLEGL